MSEPAADTAPVRPATPMPDPVPAAARAAGLRPPKVLLLPGWLDSGPAHWQSRWEALHGDLRVQQADWEHPLRGDWMARLDEVVADLPPDDDLLLAAHSLGCLLVAGWAAHSRHAGRVRGALLVAPADVERPDAPLPLTRWRPIVRQPLPFRALVVASTDDPFSARERSRQLAADWGARLHEAGPRGHLNGESGLGHWPRARHWLADLAAGRLPDAG